jgi:hypothetical protein
MNTKVVRFPGIGRAVARGGGATAAPTVVVALGLGLAACQVFARSAILDPEIATMSACWIANGRDYVPMLKPGDFLPIRALSISSANLGSSTFSPSQFAARVNLVAVAA